jgi:hypothetical protein
LVHERKEVRKRDHAFVGVWIQKGVRILRSTALRIAADHRREEPFQSVRLNVKESRREGKGGRRRVMSHTRKQESLCNRDLQKANLHTKSNARQA